MTQLINKMAMYICRSCGAEIATPASYIRCPVCGIRIN